MTDVLIVVALVLVAASATAAVANRDPARQAFVLSFLGLSLALLFTFVQAPDVALSQVAVGVALTPLMILLAVRKVTRGSADRPRDRDRGQEREPRREREPGQKRGRDR